MAANSYDDKHLQPHHSLPARPPASSNYSAPPVRHSNTSTATPSYGNNAAAFGGFMPRQVPASPAYVSGGADTSYTASGYAPQAHASSSSYYQQNGYGTATPPVMSSAYSVPGQPARGYGRDANFDPEEAAQLAEWQSAYVPKEDGSSKRPAQSNTRANASSGDGRATPDAGSSGANEGKKKTVMREGGGKRWEDETLLEWDPHHPRLFVGNLAGEVTDESLLKAFSKYPSVSKARVVRDKHSTKSKSFGFVSFANTDDYFRAAKEMQGKYIGSHPVIVKRANTEIKATTKKDNTHGKAKQNKPKGGIAGLLAAGNYGVNNGIQKPNHKGSKGGPKMLG